MVFQKLPSNSKALLDALVKADNPTQELCGRWDSATGAEMDELKGIISELRQLGYLNVQYADNKPYRVSLTNSARTYNERLAEYEDERARQSATYIVDQSVRIGDHNKINNSNKFEMLIILKCKVFMHFCSKTLHSYEIKCTFKPVFMRFMNC